MHRLIVLASLMICYILVSQNIVEATKWKLSKEEDLEFERQLKLLNKPAIKTIHTEYGDIYDCVDFYKQPAFDHPLLKNHTRNAQKRPYSLNEKDKGKGNVVSNLGLKGESCPIGTVLIKRITKRDLIGASLRKSLTKNDYNGTHYAICHTVPGQQWPPYYIGAQATITSHNPRVSGLQYSAARLKLVVNDQDSIEVGWMVDPTLFGDKRTRLYVYTQIGESNCFNTMCPGFVATSTIIPLGAIMAPISRFEGPVYDSPFSIVYDGGQENWILRITKGMTQVGYWPKTLFASSTLPNYVEWGGETFNPPGDYKPPMGSGLPLQKDTKIDASMRQMKVVLASGQVVDPVTSNYVSQGVYDVNVPGYIDNYYEYLMFYGGPGE